MNRARGKASAFPRVFLARYMDKNGGPEFPPSPRFDYAQCLTMANSPLLPPGELQAADRLAPHSIHRCLLP
jgi:hypothetical protein